MHLFYGVLAMLLSLLIMDRAPAQEYREMVEPCLQMQEVYAKTLREYPLTRCVCSETIKAARQMLEVATEMVEASHIEQEIYGQMVTQPHRDQASIRKLEQKIGRYCAAQMTAVQMIRILYQSCD